MTYQKQNFKNGNILTAEQLNHIEDGVVAANEFFYTPQTLTEEQKAQARENIGLAINPMVEPAEDDIPKVFFGGVLPQTKDDVVMSFRYISKTADISGYCKTKAQGTSSMGYPKKNQTVKLYKDAECTEKLKVNFRGWGEQNKFCFKANWIDITHARNVVTARLWGDVVKSRSSYEELPEPLRTAPNQGAIDGFPVKVYADGVYQGRYTINIPKDGWMANMDDELDTHCILCGESNEAYSSLFRAEANIDETDWSDELHDAVPESIKTRWNEVIRFVMNSTDEEFEERIMEYFDLPSLIDYYLFGLAICGYDNFGKNQLYMTYDGQKWFATMYDLDSTWCLWWDGTHFVPTEYSLRDFLGIEENDSNLLYSKLERLFMHEIEARWNELRNGVLSVDSIINRFERFTDICPPWLTAEDYAETTAGGAFADIPSKTTNNIQQIRDFAKKRHAYTSAYLGGYEYGCLELFHLSETEFKGNRVIDTGVDLNELDAYTVLADYTVHDISKQGFVLDNADDGKGWLIQYSSAVAFGAFGAGSTNVVDAVHPWDTTDPTGIRVKVMIRKTAEGVYQFRSSDMANPYFCDFTDKIGGASGQNLWVGGAFYVEGGGVNNFANATIHNCEVYDAALADDIVLAYLEG